MSIRGGLPIGFPVLQKIEAWRLGFYTYFLLVNLGFGMYLTISRDMVQYILGYNYSFMSIVVAAENIPLIVSALGGGLGDIIGRRQLVLTGALSAIPLFLLGFLPIKYLPLLAGTYIFFWSLAQPSITGALLHATSSSGVQYSIYAVFGTIGWGIGGPLAGVLISTYGWRPAWIASGIITLLSFIIAYLFFPHSVIGGEASVSDLFHALSRIYPFFTANVLVISGFLLFYGNYSLVLRGRISDPGLYGLVYTFIPAVVGIIARPIIGLISEKIDPLKLAFGGTILYILVVSGLYYSTGPLMIILWAFPIYPFIDQGFMLTYSRRLPGSLQAFASGLWGTAFSIGGLVVFVIGLTLTHNSLGTIYFLSLLFLSASMLLTGWLLKKSGGV